MRSLAFVLLIVLLPPFGAASVSVYHSRAEWEAAVPGFTTDGFESYPFQSTSGGSLVFDAFDFFVPFNHEPLGTCWIEPTDPSSCGTVVAPDPANIVLVGDVHDDSDGSYNELVFRDPIHWFAIDFLWLEDAELGSSIAIGSGDLFEETIDAYPSFIGFVSPTPFTSVVIRGSRVHYVVDDVSYGTTPEPSTGMLLAAGLLGLAFERARRRRIPNRTV